MELGITSPAATVDTANADELADLGVESNSRLTGVLGAILFVTLAVEGITIYDVRSMLSLHVFIGLFIVPIVCVKLGTTSWRAVNYYRGTPAYERKGPPHPVLRLLAPVVILSTIAMIVFGIITMAAGPQHREPWLTWHQGSFIVWLVATSVHVLGHLVETWKLTTGEVVNRPAVPRRGTRMGVIVMSLAIGVLLGVLSLGWHGAWNHFQFHFDH